jgi:effector-binding domain-containing protein
MKKLSVLSALVIAVGMMVQAGAAQTQPVGGGAGVDTEPSIGQMRVRKLPGFTYLYASREVTIGQIGPAAHAELPKLLSAMKAKGIFPTGPAVLTYHGATGDPNQKFQMDVGIQVAEGTDAPAGYQVKKVQPALSATVLYGGAVSGLKKAYGELFGNLPSRDLIPTGETREYYMSWDSADSPNNVLLLVACVG